MKGYRQNEIKLTFYSQETKFFVNKKNNTVTCVLKSHLKTPYNLYGIIDINQPLFKTIGTAKCHYDDNFDEERGKRIALAKAENKAYDKAIKYLEEQKEELVFYTNLINHFGFKSKAHCEHNKEYIKKISDLEHPEYKEYLAKLRHGYTNGQSNNPEGLTII